MQSEVLRPGELLLDYYLGRSESFLFAMTIDDLRVVRLPPARELEEKLRAYFQLVSAPPASRRHPFDPALLARVGGRIAALLFDEVDAMIAANRVILVSGDGMLSLLPMEELHGHLAPGSGPKDLAASPVWVRVPSASILAELRARPPDPGAGPSRLLALAGGRSASGDPLRGSIRETRSLGGRYRGAIVRTPEAPSDSVLELLARADLIHIAAHLAIDDASPWRSEIRFQPRGSPVNLRASRIVAARLPARIAVLSSCSSAGGRVLSGEGVRGVTSAFLSAGVPSVVATLWAVDDRTTADLMRLFYDRLERGETAALALRGAKDAIRSRPETRAPFYWAGFVLVGDGEQKVHLERRAAPWIRWVFAAAFVGLALGYAGRALGRPRGLSSLLSRHSANRSDSADRV